MSTDRVASLVSLGRWQEARQLADSLLAAEPDNVTLLGYRTQCLYEQGLLVEALASGNRMVATAPLDDWAHRLCALVLDRMGRHEEALRASAEAVRLDPNHWPNHANYATAAVDVRGRLFDALQAARRSVELAPNEPDAHFILGVVHHRRNEIADARAAYERALALDPEHAHAVNNLTVLGGLHRTIRASHGFASALRFDPQNAVARENLDALLVNFTLILYLLGGAGVVAALAATRAGDGPGAPTVVVAVCFTAALIGYVAWVASSVPRGVRRYVAQRWRSKRLAVWNSVLATVEIALVYVVCFAPDGEQIGLVAIRPVLLTMVILGVQAIVRQARR